jgi:hypothetical protein
MRCIECEREAVALCPRCLVGQCPHHLNLSREVSARSGALAGCEHVIKQVSSRA